MEKITSLLLAISMLFSSLGFNISLPNSPDNPQIPVVHVVGSGAKIVRRNDDGIEETLYPPQIPEGYIEEAANKIFPVFAEAFFSQNWDEFCDVLLDIIVPLFSPMALDKNGEPSDGSFAAWHWSRDSLRSKMRPDGTYGATTFEFHYDWRLDPLDTAELLHLFIEDVMYVTGSDKVALYGRCLGSNVVAAYMYRYDGENVDEVIHYASSVYGATQCSKAFTGELCIHADGLNRFAYEIEYLGFPIDDVYIDLIQALITILNDTYGLDVAAWAINNVLQDIYLDIFPEFMRSSYGTFPSYWSMVRLDDYNKAMETVFYGADKSEYAGLINKVENYRNNVQIMFGQRSMEQHRRGIEFSNIVKYGFQSIPVTYESDKLSDGLVSVNESSFGATTAETVNDTLSQDYLDIAMRNGMFKYISPDRQIDASTCLSPDTTWFIKNLYHMDFPETVNGLVSDIVNNKNFNINSNPEYPQYLVFDSENGEIIPMDEENYNTTDRWQGMTFTDAVKLIIEFIKSLIEGNSVQFR